jgi:ribosomal protein L37AE/L43A
MIRRRSGDDDSPTRGARRVSEHVHEPRKRSACPRCHIVGWYRPGGAVWVCDAHGEYRPTKGR